MVCGFRSDVAAVFWGEDLQRKWAPTSDVQAYPVDYMPVSHG